MKPKDLLKIYCSSYPAIEENITIAEKLLKDGKIEHGGEKYRDVARLLLKHNLNSLAIQYYGAASEQFISCKNYDKAINSEISISTIYLLNNDIPSLANSHEKIASFYNHLLKDYKAAGPHYFSSAKYHEANQNYRAAFKKALFACECYEKIGDRKIVISTHNFAFRMAVQSGYLEKASAHILKIHSYIPKDYSSHYISVCVKGFITCQQAKHYGEALMFINEIIEAHYGKGIKQEQIKKYLLEQQKLFMQVHKTIDTVSNERLINLSNRHNVEITNFSLELLQFAENIGLPDSSDFFYVQKQEYRKREFKAKKNYLKFSVYYFWKLTCLFGTSLTRWLAFSIIAMAVFGLIFSSFPCPSFFPEFIKDSLIELHPQIKIESINNAFSPFYYSIVTFTTLGYGDITPANFAAQFYSVLEVFTGYLMLGGLLSVFSKKIIR